MYAKITSFYLLCSISLNKKTQLESETIGNSWLPEKYLAIFSSYKSSLILLAWVMALQNKNSLSFF